MRKNPSVEEFTVVAQESCNIYARPGDTISVEHRRIDGTTETLVKAEIEKEITFREAFVATALVDGKISYLGGVRS